jgi:hypothetical protein
MSLATCMRYIDSNVFFIDDRDHGSTDTIEEQANNTRNSVIAPEDYAYPEVEGPTRYLCVEEIRYVEIGANQCYNGDSYVNE